MNIAISSGLSSNVSSMVGRPVFVYDTGNKGEPFVYGSINYTLQALNLSHGRLLGLIANQLLFNGLALSFTALTLAQVEAYAVEGPKDNLTRTQIQLYDANGNLASFIDPLTEESFDTFSSGRKFAGHFKMDPKKGGGIIKSGVFGKYTIVTLLVNSRKPVYVFDAVTMELVKTIPNTNAAVKYAKVHFNNFKLLLDTRTVHNGQYFSSTPKLK